MHNLQVKLTGASLTCPMSGCESVLSSSYSELFGVPLSLFGLLTYGTVGAVALTAATQPTSSNQGTLDTSLATGTSLLAGVSGFLMYVAVTGYLVWVPYICWLHLGMYSFVLLNSPCTNFCLLFWCKQKLCPAKLVLS